MRTAVILAALVATALGAPSCGQTPVKPNVAGEKIIGGSDAVPYSWPWQTVFCSSGWFGGCSLECSATIIDNNFVMTGAVCVADDMNPKNYQVLAAVFKEDSTTEAGEQVVNVKSITANPDYNTGTNAGDIAIIELATPLTYGDHIQPICLPTDDSSVTGAGAQGWVTGWGSTEEGGDVNQNLRQAKIPFVDFDTCSKEYPGQIDTKVEVCAGAPGMDSCSGDSGGPLQVQSASGAWYQVGIVSWGKGCAEVGEAGVYSRVSGFCDFISTSTKGKVSCQAMV